MKSFFRHLIVLSTILILPAVCVAAPVLTSNAYVNVTSDTAANAKTMAFNEARRQIIDEVLSKFVDQDQFRELMKNTKDADLTNLISSSGIDSERLSSTTYSANIKMTVDLVEARKWLDDNNIMNWLGTDDSLPVDRSTLVIDVSGGLPDWVELGSALRNGQIDIDVKRISSGVITASIPVTKRAELITTVRGAGWQYSDVDGFLKIWK